MAEAAERRVIVVEPRLAFDADTHIYRYDGERVPSVTQALSVLGAYDDIPEDVLSKAAAWGNAVHQATELDDLGALDEDAMDSRLRPYVEAWREFKHDSGYEPVEVECRVYHPKWRYAGTPDRVMRRLDGARAVVDIKRTYVIDPMVDLQTAAYKAAFNARSADEIVDRRLAVQLKKDGRYQVRGCDRKGDTTDFQTFLACLQVWHWKERNA